MTAADRADDRSPPEGPEADLLLRVLTALLREDVVGLRTRGVPVERGDGPWLAVPSPDVDPPDPRRPNRGCANTRTGDSGAEPGALLVPVAPDGFLCRIRARLPLVRRTRDGAVLTRLDDVLRELRAWAAPSDRAGFEAFAQECRQTLATLRWQRRGRPGVLHRLRSGLGDDLTRWTGLRGALAFDTLAGFLGHPVYPTAAGRAGLTERDLQGYAPEGHPCFAVRWVVVPRGSITSPGLSQGADPGGFRSRWPRWPAPSQLGCAGVDHSHLALPVHPLTFDGPLVSALREAGLKGVDLAAFQTLNHRRLVQRGSRGSRPPTGPDAAFPGGGPPPDGVDQEDGDGGASSTGWESLAILPDAVGPQARPTLSMRTVALAEDPTVHLKLPLNTSTLGRLNRRTIKPGSLVDGAATQRLLERVLEGEPRFRDVVLLADERCYAHAGHELLGVLVRRYPPELADSLVVPLAALLAEAPDGRMVIDQLAVRFFDGEPLTVLDAVLTPLFQWQVTLFRYGIALESHQQNTSLVLDRVAGHPRVRLLFKDNDGPRINLVRLRQALGASAPDPREFDDARILTEEDRPLTDLFTTITVHLCAAALAFGLVERGRTSRGRAVGLIRERLEETIDALADTARPAAHGRAGAGPVSSGDAGSPEGDPADPARRATEEPAAVLRRHVLDALDLPVKAMVSAGTLLTKERSGAKDVNKHYTRGPNYLRSQKPPPGGCR